MKRRTKRTAANRTPRPPLRKSLGDLADRLDHELTVIDWIKEVAEPHGKTLYGAVPTLRVLQFAIAEHGRALQQIRRDVATY
jgi:hypothetical protein